MRLEKARLLLAWWGYTEEVPLTHRYDNGDLVVPVPLGGSAWVSAGQAPDFAYVYLEFDGFVPVQSRKFLPGETGDVSLQARRPAPKQARFIDQHDQPVSDITVDAGLFWSRSNHCGYPDGLIPLFENRRPDVGGVLLLPDADVDYGFRLGNAAHMSIVGAESFEPDFFNTHIDAPEKVVRITRHQRAPLTMRVSIGGTPAAGVVVGATRLAGCMNTTFALGRTDERGMLRVPDFYPEEYRGVCIGGTGGTDGRPVWAITPPTGGEVVVDLPPGTKVGEVTYCGAQQNDVSGVVFVDANGNGLRDAGETGLANIVVSNQNDVVTTGATGAYQLPRSASGVLFVSVPNGYRSIGPFWRALEGTTTSVDFALAPSASPSEFTFIHASDTHIAPAVSARTERLRELTDSIDPAFVIISGDLVRDALRVGEDEATGDYELFGREIAKFTKPVWTVPGNHENFGVERDKSNVSTTHPLYGRQMYRHYRGPDYYSFNVGGVHFVALNTVGIDDQWYYGHVDSTQLAWLERDLASIPETMPVVTFNHIPFFTSIESMHGYTDDPPAPTLITVDGKTSFRHTVSNAADVLAVLRTRRHVLALGGHMHTGERITYEMDGLVTRFNQAPAIVGPSGGAGMRFTSGFMVYTVRDGVIDDGRFVPLGLERPLALR